jgi:hypothetical protein
MLYYYISLHAGKLEHHTFPLCIPPPSTTQCSARFIILPHLSDFISFQTPPLRYTCLIAPALPDLASPCATFLALPLALVPSNIPQLTACSSLTQPMTHEELKLYSTTLAARLACLGLCTGWAVSTVHTAP